MSGAVTGIAASTLTLIDRMGPVVDFKGTRQAGIMCHFMTLIAPTNDVAAVRAIMERHGRAAEPIDNPSIRRVLSEVERQYLTTRGHCDCGTILAHRYDTPEEIEDAIAKEVARMKRKGWSDAKIGRAIDDQRKADAKPDRSGPDSLELWSAALVDLKVELNLPYVGIFVRSYSGAIASEAFNASRRDVPKSKSLRDALASLEHDEATIFR